MRKICYSVYIKNIELHGCTVNINMKLSKVPNKYVSKKSPKLNKHKLLNKNKNKSSVNKEKDKVKINIQEYDNDETISKNNTGPLFKNIKLANIISSNNPNAFLKDCNIDYKEEPH